MVSTDAFQAVVMAASVLSIIIFVSILCYIVTAEYFPLRVRGSRIGLTCPPACRKRRLIGGDTNLDWILHNKFLFCFLIICIFYTF